MKTHFAVRSNGAIWKLPPKQKESGCEWSRTYAYICTNVQYRESISHKKRLLSKKKNIYCNLKILEWMNLISMKSTSHYQKNVGITPASAQICTVRSGSKVIYASPPFFHIFPGMYKWCRSTQKSFGRFTCPYPDCRRCAKSPGFSRLVPSCQFVYFLERKAECFNSLAVHVPLYRLPLLLTSCFTLFSD